MMSGYSTGWTIICINVCSKTWCFQSVVYSFCFVLASLYELLQATTSAKIWNSPMKIMANMWTIIGRVSILILKPTELKRGKSNNTQLWIGINYAKCHEKCLNVVNSSLNKNYQWKTKKSSERSLLENCRKMLAKRWKAQNSKDRSKNKY